eukprot:Cvel_24468.t1-p1 / transcript=Cvel_24468.t1 / gene=Cvel_24468 / organism=Chromera_velia_CCMP2878 / gene_product=hypothetical protein / transcript_product=hypothetical protein / location=Cvel_scaffold2648:299-893(-) / protein_length=198 / sequence_SO=supercontig / SO=protein_coding / is_pseudo=false
MSGTRESEKPPGKHIFPGIWLEGDWPEDPEKEESGERGQGQERGKVRGADGAGRKGGEGQEAAGQQRERQRIGKRQGNVDDRIDPTRLNESKVRSKISHDLIDLEIALFTFLTCPGVSNSRVQLSTQFLWTEYLSEHEDVQETAKKRLADKTENRFLRELFVELRARLSGFDKGQAIVEYLEKEAAEIIDRRLDKKPP